MLPRFICAGAIVLLVAGPPAEALFKPCTKFLNQVLHAQVASFVPPTSYGQTQCANAWLA
jgi:hypothetical protein